MLDVTLLDELKMAVQGLVSQIISRTIVASQQPVFDSTALLSLESHSGLEMWLSQSPTSPFQGEQERSPIPARRLIVFYNTEWSASGA